MKYKNLVILMILIVVWSLFFAIYKYFVWGIFKTETVTLQYISGYLSLGTFFSFIIGGLIYEIFREKKYHFAIMLFTIFLISSIFLFNNLGLEKSVFVAFLTLVIGFFYGLWGVLRNILISTEIEETKLGDTKINGIANIFFITSIIIGSILGGLIAEKLNIFGTIVIILLLSIGLVSGIFLKVKDLEKNINITKKALEYKKTYLEDFKFIIKKYYIVMLFVSLIITIGTILSQKAVEYFVEVGGKSGSEAATILLYTAIGSILGNIISMKIKNNRWYFFLIFSIIFSISCSLFPTFIESFLKTSILAVIAGIFFGITYNLLEAYFFKKIADDNKKSYGAVSLGLITSITIAILMFFVDILDKYFGFSGVYYFLAGIIFVIGIIIFGLKNKLNDDKI